MTRAILLTNQLLFTWLIILILCIDVYASEIFLFIAVHYRLSSAAYYDYV